MFPAVPAVVVDKRPISNCIFNFLLAKSETAAAVDADDTADEDGIAFGSG